MKKKVIIVEALSTGFNYVQDCLDLGLEPIVLETYLKDEDTLAAFDAYRNVTYAKCKEPFRVIRADESYDKTLDMVRDLSPDFIIPGAEGGVILATRLADDLGLKGNPADRIWSMTNKSGMHEALAQAGLRHIRGKICSSLEEILDYYDLLGCEEVVLKPLHGAGAQGVCVCQGKDELIANYKKSVGSVSFLGDRNDDYLLQEYISGQEYVVNTLSIDGTPYLTSLWKYEKYHLEHGEIIEIGVICLDHCPDELKDLLAYAFDTVKAVGIQNGPVHGEYMMTHEGPVLMEVNCRPMGATLPSDFLDQIFHHHETDLALLSYVDPNTAQQRLCSRYKTYGHGKLKDIIVPYDTPVTASPITEVLDSLESVYCYSVQTAETTDHLVKTMDLETHAGMVYMFHQDPDVLQREYDYLHDLEFNHFHRLYTG